MEGLKVKLKTGWLVLSLVMAGCSGSLTFGGQLWPETDDDDDDDDDTVADDDDDSGADDDDTVSDDDDTEPIGGPVFCGPTPSPASGTGEPLRVYTGLADVLFKWEKDGARGGVFSADWSGCEALHRYDSDGEYFCGILWTATGNSYGEQILSSGLVLRFEMSFELTKNTCGDHPEAGYRETYFRLSLPFEEHVARITYSSEPNTLPNNMETWAEASYESDDMFPELMELEYFTSFRSDLD